MEIYLKKKMSFQDFIFSASQHKVLKFLCEYMGKDFYDSEIGRLLPNVSRASANNALRKLADMGITNRYFIGNIALNRAEPQKFFVREFRKFMYIVELAPFIEEIQEIISYVAIYGDYIEVPFTDTPIAHILIVTERQSKVSQIFKQCKYAKHLEPIFYTPAEFESFKIQSPHEWEEVQKGLPVYVSI